ncbi:hypothetical protein NW752_009777 [Fusarium irregulare]|uniref:Uncharacterized protein n=1 Tax=Fusarium irregulare TaxID=2494466 RepID=A0A9W8PY81_9HYPO|nr:hypothetical protein NW752_009777 [Fusarium irregulare]KAJ4021017.1 hypothetical protein NW766_002516 [Fusarium irregulare]
MARSLHHVATPCHSLVKHPYPNPGIAGSPSPSQASPDMAKVVVRLIASSLMIRSIREVLLISMIAALAHCLLQLGTSIEPRSLHRAKFKSQSVDDSEARHPTVVV